MPPSYRVPASRSTTSQNFPGFLKPFCVSISLGDKHLVCNIPDFPRFCHPLQDQARKQADSKNGVHMGSGEGKDKKKNKYIRTLYILTTYIHSLLAFGLLKVWEVLGSSRNAPSNWRARGKNAPSHHN